jgi:hypothetical protein
MLRYYEELKSEHGRVRVSREMKVKGTRDKKTAKTLSSKLKKFIWKNVELQIDEVLNTYTYDAFFDTLGDALNSGTRTGDGKHKYLECVIFTTNYDLCVETYCSKRGIECNNGVSFDRISQFPVLKFDNYSSFFYWRTYTSL